MQGGITHSQNAPENMVESSLDIYWSEIFSQNWVELEKLEKLNVISLGFQEQ